MSKPMNAQKTVNEIYADPKGNLFIGSLANKFLHGNLKKILNAHIDSALRDLSLYGQFLVLTDKGTLKAAQSTRESALSYMTEDRILVDLTACL